MIEKLERHIINQMNALNSLINILAITTTTLI